MVVMMVVVLIIQARIIIRIPRISSSDCIKQAHRRPHDRHLLIQPPLQCFPLLLGGFPRPRPASPLFLRSVGHPL